MMGEILLLVVHCFLSYGVIQFCRMEELFIASYVFKSRSILLIISDWIYSELIKNFMMMSC